MWTLCEIQILVTIKFYWTTAMFINLCIVYGFFHTPLAELNSCHKAQRTKICVVSTSAKGHIEDFAYSTISNPNQTSVWYYVQFYDWGNRDAERLVTCSCHIGGKQCIWNLTVLPDLTSLYYPVSQRASLKGSTFVQASFFHPWQQLKYHEQTLYT